MCNIMVLLIAALSQTSKPATTQPSSRPAATRPAVDEKFVDQELAPEDRKAFQAELAKNRKDKLPEADSVRSFLARESSRVKRVRAERVEAETKVIARKEGDRDRIRSRGVDKVGAGVSENRKTINEINDACAAYQKEIARASSLLVTIETCYQFAIDCQTHLKYRQIKRAVTARRVAQARYRELLDEYHPPSQRYMYVDNQLPTISREMNELRILARAEFEKLPELEKEGALREPENVVIGMHFREVRDLLGEPDNILFGRWTYRQLGKVISFDRQGRVTDMSETR